MVLRDMLVPKSLPSLLPAQLDMSGLARCPLPRLVLPLRLEGRLDTFLRADIGGVSSFMALPGGSIACRMAAEDGVLELPEGLEEDGSDCVGEKSM